MVIQKIFGKKFVQKYKPAIERGAWIPENRHVNFQT